LALFDEVFNGLDDDVFRESMEVELDRMPRPVATPIIIAECSKRT
jgi:hypothetical protein